MIRIGLQPGRLVLKAALVAGVLVCLTSRPAAAQEELVTPDPEDLLAIAQLTLGMDPVEACGDRAAQCSSASGIPHADGGWEKSCKDSRKIISLAARGKMKRIHKGVCKAKYLVVDADQEGQPTLRYADYAMYDGKECKRWPDASARTTMTEEEVEIAALEGRLVGARKLRGALFKWFKAQSNPPPFSALPLTAKKKIDPTKWVFDAVSPTCGCKCAAWEMVDPVTHNARRGDVAIVSITDGEGDETVAEVMKSLQQNHRHALMFTSRNSVRHATSFLGTKATEGEGWEKGDAQNCEWDAEPMGDRWKNTYIPGNGTHLYELNGPSLQGIRPEFIRNGLPGTVSQSVRQAMACKRLGLTGLLLTHPEGGSLAEIFLDAADIAESWHGYYKVSEYSGLGGWNLSIAGNYSPSPPITVGGYDTRHGKKHTYEEKFEKDNLRGTHCSGFIQASMNAALQSSGTLYGVASYEYDQSTRKKVAKQLYASTVAKVEQELMGTFAGFIFNIDDVAERIANQVVNCFGGVDKGRCMDRGSTWKKALGTGATVAPDNLLPGPQFTLQNPGGSGGSSGHSTLWMQYPPFLVELRPGDTVDSSIGHEAGQVYDFHNSIPPSPFVRVEPLVIAGSTWTYADVPMVGDWAQELPTAP